MAMLNLPRYFALYKDGYLYLLVLKDIGTHWPLKLQRRIILSSFKVDNALVLSN